MSNVNIGIALWAGFLSFISPCCLPLYPSYLSYLTGISVGQLRSGQTSAAERRRTMLHTLCFIAGFSIIFYTLGIGAGIVGSVFIEYRGLLRQLAAVLMLVMGLLLLGVFQPQWLMKERKLQIAWRPAGYLGSVLVGLGFAAGWSPCIGPILTAISAFTATQSGQWFAMTTAYTLGFAIPFFVLSFFISSTKWILRYSNAMMKAGGAVMLVIAVLLYTDRMTQITIWLNSHTPNWLKI
jgi:cytochrome c-type biogenesis protein